MVRTLPWRQTTTTVGDENRMPRCQRIPVWQESGEPQDILGTYAPEQILGGAVEMYDAIGMRNMSSWQGSYSVRGE